MRTPEEIVQQIYLTPIPYNEKSKKYYAEIIRSYGRECYEAGRKDVLDHMMNDYNSMECFDWTKQNFADEANRQPIPTELGGSPDSPKEIRHEQ